MDLSKNDPHNTDFQPWGMDEKQFCMFLHLSQFASYVVPVGGIVLPIIMWSSFKDQSEAINEHGKHVVNWVISSFIYAMVCSVLFFFLIGIPLLFVLGILVTVFPIIGAIKANEGIIYKYPMTISFV